MLVDKLGIIRLTGYHLLNEALLAFATREGHMEVRSTGSGGPGLHDTCDAHDT